MIVWASVRCFLCVISFSPNPITCHRRLVYQLLVCRLESGSRSYSVDPGLRVQANRAVRFDSLVRNDLVRTTPIYPYPERSRGRVAARKGAGGASRLNLEIARGHDAAQGCRVRVVVVIELIWTVLVVLTNRAAPRDRVTRKHVTDEL